MLELFDLSTIYSEQGFILAVTGALIVAATFKIAQILRQDINYTDILEGGHTYLISFALLSAVLFYIFKFNVYHNIRVIQEPQELIGLTPITMFGIGGVFLGVSYGLELKNHILFKIQNVQDILRFIVFVNVAKFARSFVELTSEVESINFIASFDYKTYNQVALVTASLISLFFLGKKFFLGALLGSGIVISQVFFRYKLFERDFLVFLIIVNIIIKILGTDQAAKKAQVQNKQEMNEEQTKGEEQKQKEDNSNKKSENQQNEDKSTHTPPIKLNSTQKSTKQSSLLRVLGASALGGIGYGFCGILPEYAVLNVAIFSPQITLVYTISFFVGFIMMVAILQIIEFDLAKQVDRQMMEEYKEHLKKKDQIRKDMKQKQN